LPQAPALHPLQQAFIEEQAPQCGYCYNGMLIKGSELLSKNPSPPRQIRSHMNGHLCRCGTYPRVMKAINASTRMASNAMTDILSDTNFSRRDLLKGGGALIVGFSMTGALPDSAAAARGEVAGRPIRTPSTRGSPCTPTTPRPCISASASLARATPPACCRLPAKSSIST
jgi:hypothetical protein